MAADLSWWWGLMIAAGGITFVMTEGIRRYALAKRLMDIPGERSSHKAPTPRGGGMAFVLVFLGALPVLVVSGVLTLPTAMALGGAGVLTAGIGFVDDHAHVAPQWRLMAHFLAAAWVVGWWLMSNNSYFIISGAPKAIQSIVAVFFLAWMLNLYNFMDGIDGIASVEAITVCLGAAALSVFHGQLSAAIAPMVLASAVAGFLVWNMPPARIFMGDGASGFLGITLGAMTLMTSHERPQEQWAWLILLGVFIVDATWTLVCRFLSGKRVVDAHRSHAYQRASQRFGGHLPVTLSVAVINVVWLTPWAVLVSSSWVPPWLGLCAAYGPLVLLAVALGAGADA